jgi:hypothetical protein
LPSREITRAELALVHTKEHIRNYFAPPPWHQTAPRAIIGPPSPPPSSTGSTTTTTVAESSQTTPPPSVPDSRDETEATFADSPIKEEFGQDFPSLQTSTGTTFRDKVSGSPHKRRASGLDMDLMTVLAAHKDEIVVKPAVWPETLTHMMGCGELAIGKIDIYITHC